MGAVTNGPPTLNGLELGLGRAHLTAKGGLTVTALSVVAIIASVLFSGWRVEQAAVRSHDATLKVLATMQQSQTSEHAAIMTSESILACVLAMTPEERKTLRERYAPGAFTLACPWIKP